MAHTQRAKEPEQNREQQIKEEIPSSTKIVEPFI